MKGTSSSFHLCFSCSSDQSLNFASKLSIAVVHRIPCKRRLCLWYGIFAESDLAYWAFCSLRPLSISSSCSRSHKHNLRGTLRENISRHWSCVSLTLVTLRTSAFCKPRRFIMAVNLSERIRKISKSVKLMRINEIPRAIGERVTSSYTSIRFHEAPEEIDQLPLFIKQCFHFCNIGREQLRGR